MRDDLRGERAPAGEIRRGLAGIVISAALAVTGASAARAQSGNAGGAALVPIHVTAPFGTTASVPFSVALKQGFFKDAGLDVNLVTMSSGGASVSAALDSGQVDISVEGAAEGMSDIARGSAPGKLIGEFTDNIYVIMGGNGITDVKQLKGKVFGISGYNGGDEIWAQAVLSHYGIPTDQVTWVPVGIPTSRLAALVTGRVDGIESSLTVVPDSEKKRIIVGADDSPVPFISEAIFVRQAFLTPANRPALRKFLDAIGKGADWTHAHPQDALPACEDDGAKEADCKLAIQFGTTSKNPYTWSSTSKLNTDAVKDMIPFVAEAVPQAKNMTVADFVDTSLAGGGP